MRLLTSGSPSALLSFGTRIASCIQTAISVSIGPALLNDGKPISRLHNPITAGINAPPYVMDFHIVSGVLIKKAICISPFEFRATIDLCKCWWMVDCGRTTSLCGDKLGLFVWNTILFPRPPFKPPSDTSDESVGFVHFSFLLLV